MLNGTRIVRDPEANGYGVLVVENGTANDAVIRLVNTISEQVIAEVYVEAKDSVRFTAIPEGEYALKYTTGWNWQDEGETFLCNASYSQFERPFRYSEQQDESRVKYNEITVTLHPVRNGTARTKPITREEFLSGHSLLGSSGEKH